MVSTNRGRGGGRRGPGNRGGRRGPDSSAPRAPQPAKPEGPRIVELPPSLTVKDLAERMALTPVDIIKALMKNGVMATINQEMDYDTAAIVAGDLGWEVKEAPSVLDDLEVEEVVPVEQEDESLLEERPPVVTVMGHVDHGKTLLLDAIRSSNVAAREAGGITQHIGAYQVVKNGHKITFLDTPGHAAFTAMRARGAQATDVAIIVVAADDGVMPQTVEAIDHAKAAGVPIVVALNKVDKADANVDRVLTQLNEIGLNPIAWGGQTEVIPVSAKTGEGIPDLLETVLLTTEIADLKANPNKPAQGVVIEARMERARGPMATMIVQSGTLHTGDAVVAGQKRAEALASTMRRPADILAQISTGETKQLNIVLKADTQGSIEAIEHALNELNGDEVKVKIIRAAVGPVTESDVLLADASQALIIGFTVRPDEGARRAADSTGVQVKYYDIIYKLIEDIEIALSGMHEPVYEEVIDGHAEVRATFKAGRTVIAGCYVTAGDIRRNAEARVLRGGELVTNGRISSLKRFKEDAREVSAGYECGIVIDGFNDFQEGDVIEAFGQRRVV